jgi:non-homologous end joining protein Ku
MLHAKDKSPINLARHQKDAKPVAGTPCEGYEKCSGSLVVLTKEDIAAATLEDPAHRHPDFVGGQSIDDRYFDKPYT